MKTIRATEIEKAKDAQFFGVILGTLGRQGSTKVLAEVQKLLQRHHKKYFVLFLSEIMPAKLARFKQVDAWI
jgi:2-(3-amino-3-carboxypropyl)histidine synthase